MSLVEIMYLLVNIYSLLFFWKTKQSLTKQDLVSVDFGYFNLHGVVDRPEWFGQRDYLDPPGNDYPVALSPDGGFG